MRWSRLVSLMYLMSKLLTTKANTMDLVLYLNSLGVSGLVSALLFQVTCFSFSLTFFFRAYCSMMSGRNSFSGTKNVF